MIVVCLYDSVSHFPVLYLPYEHIEEFMQRISKFIASTLSYSMQLVAHGNHYYLMET